MMLNSGRAMREKAEHDTARLLDFDLRRVRATRIFEVEHGLDEAIAPKLVARRDGAPACEQLSDYARLSAVAHAQLVWERGGPTPLRLV